MSARRDRSRRRRVRPVAGRRAPRCRRLLPAFLLSAVIIVTPVLGAAMAAVHTAEGQVIAAAVQRFLLYYSGVFALVALTAAVGAGLLAADKIVLPPGRRVAAQAVHRAISLVALAALATHIVFEIIAHRARVTDAFVPFLTQRRTFYMGVGTIASDLVVLIIATGIVRRRFAGGRVPWAWRVLHVTAYLAWPFALLHGLLGGRPAQPYVNWSYAACLAAVALALVVRHVAKVRGRDTAGQPVPDRASWPAHAAAPAGTRPAAELAAQPGLPRPAPPRRPRLALAPAGQAGAARDPLRYERDRPGDAHDRQAGRYQGAASVVRVGPAPGDQP